MPTRYSTSDNFCNSAASRSPREADYEFSSTAESDWYRQSIKTYYPDLTGIPVIFERHLVQRSAANALDGVTKAFDAAISALLKTRSDFQSAEHNEICSAKLLFRLRFS